MKETFGAEVADQLLAAVRRYEEEDGYEGLITSAVGLLTQRDDGLLLLQGQTHALSSDSPRHRLTRKKLNINMLLCYDYRYVYYRVKYRRQMCFLILVVVWCLGLCRLSSASRF